MRGSFRSLSLLLHRLKVKATKTASASDKQYRKKTKVASSNMPNNHSENNGAVTEWGFSPVNAGTSQNSSEKFERTEIRCLRLPMSLAMKL